MRTPKNAASQFGPAYDKGQRTLSMTPGGDCKLGWGKSGSIHGLKYAVGFKLYFLSLVFKGKCIPMIVPTSSPYMIICGPASSG